MVDKGYKNLSMSRQCKLLEINRSSIYYKAQEESELNQKLMLLIKEKFDKRPFFGVPRMFQWLRKDKGFIINEKRVERLYKKLGLKAITPKRNLSNPIKEHLKYPYLLNDITISKPGQVWQTDITYIPMKKGYMYLTAIIDVYSRMIVSWAISNTMSADWCKSTLEEAINKYGKPEIVNTDQGSQYTSEIYINFLKENEIQISMDGKGRALDNIFIERFWRSLKYENLYLYAYENGLELYKGINKYFNFYNYERRHQSLDYVTPAELFFLSNCPKICEGSSKEKII